MPKVGEEIVHAIIAMGHPDEKYQALTGRKKVVMRYFDTVRFRVRLIQLTADIESKSISAPANARRKNDRSRR